MFIDVSTKNFGNIIRFFNYIKTDAENNAIFVIHILYDVLCILAY